MIYWLLEPEAFKFFLIFPGISLRYEIGLRQSLYAAGSVFRLLSNFEMAKRIVKIVSVDIPIYAVARGGRGNSSETEKML